MITGGHVVIFSKNAEADREFVRDVLGFDAVDAGGGWLLFALPPSELAFHPREENDVHELYLMCDDLEATTAELAARGVSCDEPTDEAWGRLTTLRLPGGGELGLYEPKHPVAFSGA